MIKNLHSATINVSNQDAALEFYVSKLGWEKRIDNMMGPTFRFITVAPKGAQSELALGMHEHMGGPKPGEGVFGGPPGLGKVTGISLQVENIDETYRALLDKGVRFSSAPEPMPWGDKATWLYDPDGNAFFFVGR